MGHRSIKLIEVRRPKDTHRKCRCCRRRALVVGTLKVTWTDGAKSYLPEVAACADQAASWGVSL